MTVGGPSVTDSEDPLLNRVLSERYRILKKLGEGGMGVVYLAEHVVIEKKIALKVLFPDLTRRSDLVQRFLQEAKSASRIGHENVIDITDFGQSPEGYVFIAMEYLVGQDLGQLLKASGPLPWPRAQPIVLQIVKALRAAHERGIVHRDMKPENVFVSPRDDGREFVKVLDFGIAKVLGLDEEAPRLTRTGMIFGTPEYMSPEQAQGQPVDHRVDIYAVGCILYHMLTGEVPFKAESFMGILSKHMVEAPIAPSTRNPAVEPQVEALINRAMEKDPTRRFQTMGEFADALLPLGHISDRSGALFLPPSMPARHAGMPARPSSSPPSSPYATKEVVGRVSAPLAEANPEARQSQTEIFSRDPESPPPRPLASKVALVAAGVAVVAVGAILFLALRGPAGGSGAPPTGTAARTIPAASDNAPAAAPATSAVMGSPAPTVALPTAAKSGGSVAAPAPADPTANRASATKKAKDGGRTHRTSREAIDSLFPAEPDTTSGKTGGGRTPSELKNPFAAP
jgi:serine/threonine protein kinase